MKSNLHIISSLLLFLLFQSNNYAQTRVNIVGWDGNFFNYKEFRFTSDDFIARYPYANTGIQGNIGVSTINTFGGVSPSTASDVTGDNNQVIFNENPAGHQPINQVGSGWLNGNGTKGWVFSFISTNYKSLQFSGKMAATSTIPNSNILYQGPRDFQLQYSLNQNTWNNVPNAILKAANAGNGSSINFSSLNAIALPAATENQPIVYLRMIMTSNFDPNGITISSQTGTSYIDDFKVTGISTSSLPVTLDDITATITDYTLNIKWNTLSEINNDHFNIELSRNGTSFFEVEKIKSQASNGNSVTPLNYNFNYDLNNLPGQLAAVSFIIALLLFTPASKKRKSFGLLLSLLLITSFIYSCTKQLADKNSKIENIWVKIIQVDKDGTEKNSKIIKAVNL